MISYVSLSRKYFVALLLSTLVIMTGCAGTGAVRSVDSAGQTPAEYPENLPPVVLNHVIAAALYESQGDFMHALHEYYNALAYDSSQVELYIAISDMHRALNEPDLARLILTNGLKTVGSNAEILLPLGRLQYQTYRFDEALSTFEKLVKLEPENGEAWATLAALYERFERPMDAVEIYRRLETLEPDSREILLSRQGSILSQQGLFEEALEVYKRLEILRPNSHLIPFMIGGLQLDMGDTVKAFDSFEQASRLAPEEVRYWDLRIRIAVILDDTSKALAAVDSALYFHPDEIDLLTLASSVNHRYGLTDRAIANLYHVIEIDSVEVNHRLNLGFLLHDEGRWDEAEEVYGKAIEMAPDDPQVLNNYAYMLAESGRRLQEAHQYILKALEQQPQNGSYMDTMGWVLFKMGNLHESLAVLQKAVELEPANPEVLEHLGDVYSSLGDEENAHRLWTSALENGGEAESLREKLNP